MSSTVRLGSTPTARRRTTRDWLVPVVCGVVALAVLGSLLIELALLEPHPLYSLPSVVLMLVSSVILFGLSLTRSVTAQLACLSWTLYFSHRFVSTYWMPWSFDYNSYVQFSVDEIQRGITFYLLCVVGLLCGTLLSKARLTSRRPVSHLPRAEPGGRLDTLSVLGVRVGLTAFLKPYLWIICILFTLKVYYAMVHGVGLTGVVYAQELAPLMRILTLADTLSLPLVFILIYLPRTSPVFRLAVVAFVFFALSGVLSSSRAIIWSTVFSMYASARVLHIPIAGKYYRRGLAAIGFAVFIYYPFITGVRSALIQDDIREVTLSRVSYPQLVSQISARVGVAYESFFLWFAEGDSAGINRDQLSLYGDAALLVNSLVPGEILPVAEAVNLSKMQTVIGRGADPATLEELGGHAENVGQWATPYLYFGYFATFYWAVLYFVLIKVEQSALHPFWKYFFVTTYASGPSGVVLMSPGVFTFLFLLSPLALLIAFRQEVVKAPRHGLTTDRRRTQLLKGPL